jgi:hypothetical protein
MALPCEYDISAEVIENPEPIVLELERCCATTMKINNPTIAWAAAENRAVDHARLSAKKHSFAPEDQELIHLLRSKSLDGVGCRDYY